MYYDNNNKKNDKSNDNNYDNYDNKNRLIDLELCVYAGEARYGDILEKVRKKWRQRDLFHA